MTNTRNCNFCKQSGHNIMNCDSPLINEFKQKCVLKATGFNYNESSYIVEHEYLNWLRLQPKQLIKVLALNLLLITSTSKRIGIYIDLISKHMLSCRTLQILNDTYNCELHTLVRNFINSQEPTVQQQIISFIYSQESTTIQNTYQLVFDTFMSGRLNITENISVFYEKINNLNNDSIQECNICYENIPLTHIVTYNCNHSFCGLCTEKYIKSISDNSNAVCAMCRTYIKNIKTHDINVLIHIQDAIHDRNSV